MALKNNTWKLNQWYDQAVAGNITYNILDNPEFFNWGFNDKGQLGQNNTTHYSSPVQVPGATWDLNPSNGACMDHFLATKTDGTLWGWGKNGSGQLGQNSVGSPANSGISSPVQVGSDTTWDTSCCAGGQDVRCTKTDGTLWAWGSSYWGQAGQNTGHGGGQYNWSSPVQIPGTWALGENKHSYMSNAVIAIKGDGTLWTWGYNGYGCLGHNEAPGNRGGYSSPVQIPGSWSNVLAGSQETQSGAIKTDGTLWMWGRNERGTLGQNDTAKYSSPAQIPGTTWANGRFINQSALLTKTDGTMWTIGDNSAGQLGHNSKVQYSSPVQVGTESNWSTNNFIGGYYFSIAAKTDGTLWSWGYNAQGQLAQNDKAQRSSPIQIPGQWTKLQSGGQSAMAHKIGTP
mgnify:CR=1 FL=1